MTLLTSIVVMLLLCLSAAHAQQERSDFQLNFRPFVGSVPLQLDTIYTLDKNQTIEFSTLKWYISGVELLRNDTVFFAEPNSYHLLDVSDEHLLHIPLSHLPSGQFTHVRFYLGIDSATTTSGAFGGDLDPTRGMLWTWQSGYIHTKIEGKSSRSTARNKEFEFHLGGYRSPFNSLQTITLPLPSSREVSIKMDVLKWINSIDLASVHHIMSPGEQAVLLSQQFATIFRVEAR
ncbi:MAG: hypothetical protein IPM69_13235 [Ignavibacteria bacterium]|nr:hypothetical protein [Ignavibacteria bacterium]